jgi:acetylornithine deacetylase/succinyl-diaminopimelate desuccinylase-like protein
MLPNVDPIEVRQGIIAALGDPGIDVSAAPALNPTQPSPLLPDVFEKIESLTRQMFGDIPVIPTMGTGATDSKSFRRIGIPSYGVSGIFNDPDDNRTHGRDERILVKSYFDGLEFLYRLTKALTEK